MAWQAKIAVQKGVDHLEVEINDNGIAHARAVAGLIAPEDVNVEKRKKLENLVRPYSRNSNLLDISIMGPQDQLIADVMGQERRTVEEKKVSYTKADEAGVTISELEVNGVPVRSFSTSIPNAGRVEVLVSVESIRRSRDDLSRSLTQVTLIASIGGAFAAFLLATFLTRPIRTLMRDLRQVSLGDLQHQSRVTSGDELGNLARTFNQMTRSLHTAQALSLIHI